MIDPAAPPDLAHSTILTAAIGGEPVDTRDLFWNRLLLVVVRRACAKHPTEDFPAMMGIRTIPGRNPARSGEYVEELRISIPAMSANEAWQAIYGVLRHAGMSADVEFSWSRRPAETSRMTVRQPFGESLV